MDKVYIFGHRNPDTDSVTSAIALEYLKIAADAGIVQAEYDYGLYLYDCGTTEELQNAVLYFKRASSNNHAYSMYQLALCYQLGRGVSRDVKIAKEYLVKAAELGVYKAKEILEEL